MHASGRRISPDVQRQALSVVLLGVMLVGVATLLLLSVSDLPLHAVLFEAVSALVTFGLSTGITAKLPPSGRVILVLLMFVGRIGSITVAIGLALQSRQRPYRYQEERPIGG